MLWFFLGFALGGFCGVALVCCLLWHVDLERPRDSRLHDEEGDTW